MKKSRKLATYGASAFKDLRGSLPQPFPREMGPNCMRYVEEVVSSGLTSDMTGRFEKAFAEEMGVKHCVATPGCTPALAMLAAAFGFNHGDEIIVSPITDYGSLQGLVRENYVPVFADTAVDSVNVSADTIAPRITDRTRAILVVHKTGLLCDMDPIADLAESRGLVLYEDVCQAVFSQYKGRLAGTLGKAAGFSFDAEKTMGSDTGGCVITDDDDLAERLRFIGHSRGAYMEEGFGRKHIEPGYAYRMTQCTAAICLGQLEIVREQVDHIDKMARLLTQMLSEIGGIRPMHVPAYQDVYSCWMFGLRIDPDAFRCSAEDFAAQLAKAGIPGAGSGRYSLMPEACTFLQEYVDNNVYPYSTPPASRRYRYDASTCPTAHRFLQDWVRWTTFCARYQPEHCELAASIVRSVADANRV